jgi:hypothetical protein
MHQILLHPISKTNTSGHKGQAGSDTITLGDFNNPVSSIDRLFRQKKINKETSELNFTIEQMDLTDVYRVFHPKSSEHTLFSAACGTFFNRDHILTHNTLFSAACGTFFNRDHILTHKTSPNRYKNN